MEEAEPGQETCLAQLTTLGWCWGGGGGGGQWCNGHLEVPNHLHVFVPGSTCISCDQAEKNKFSLFKIILALFILSYANFLLVLRRFFSIVCNIPNAANTGIRTHLLVKKNIALVQIVLFYFGICKFSDFYLMNYFITSLNGFFSYTT